MSDEHQGGDQDAEQDRPEPESTGDSGDSGDSGEGIGDDSDIEEIEEERKRRLDPENRPENAEVDNTQRDFDVETGTFADSDTPPAEGVDVNAS